MEDLCDFYFFFYPFRSSNSILFWLPVTSVELLFSIIIFNSVTETAVTKEAFGYVDVENVKFCIIKPFQIFSTKWRIIFLKQSILMS